MKRKAGNALASACILAVMLSASPAAFGGFVENVQYINYRDGYKHLGDHRMNQLDIHTPSPQTPVLFGAFDLVPRLRPAVLIFHGGAFMGEDKLNLRPFAEFINSLGMVAFNVNYRLADASVPENGYPYPAAYDDSEAAIRWVRAHAREYGADPMQVVSAGYSAGATLAVHLAVVEDPSVRSQFFIDMNGRMNFTTPPIAFDSRRVFIPYPGPNGELYRVASPLYHVGPLSSSGIIVHGTLDRQVEAKQSIDFAEEMIHQHHVVWRIEVPTDHGGVVRHVIDHLADKLVEFFRPRLRPGPVCQRIMGGS
jgi:hypothetical protein